MVKYCRDVVNGMISLLAGLVVTLKHAFRKPVTLQYPDERPDLPVRFRGRLVLPVDPEKGGNRCTACMLCVRACPNGSIAISKAVVEGKPRPQAASYHYNLATCMFCNLCVEACPFAAIIMSDEYECAVADKGELQRELVAEQYQLRGKKEKWWLSKFKEE